MHVADGYTSHTYVGIHIYPYMCKAPYTVTQAYIPVQSSLYSYTGVHVYLPVPIVLSA